LKNWILVAAVGVCQAKAKIGQIQPKLGQIRAKESKEKGFALLGFPSRF